MLKKKLCEILKESADKTVQIAVNDASVWILFQDKEPQEARNRYLNKKCVQKEMTK